MNHNVITVDWLEYKAVKSHGKSCPKCAFLRVDCTDAKYDCMPEGRDDNEEVIFKRHIKLKSK